MNTKQLNLEYTARINKTFDYIESNIEKPISLDELSAVASFSKFHFNRVFRSYVGESPFQFILRLRLEKAASLLLSDRNKSISEIAFKCGFSDISVFSRNFKNHFSVSALQYRKEKLQNSNISQQESNTKQPCNKSKIYFCPASQTLKWRTNMEINKSIEVKEMPEMTIAYIRNMGPWNGDQKEYVILRNKLFAWAGAKGLLSRKDFRYLIMYHDNPNVANENKLRMSLCITVPPDTKVDGEIGKMKIQAAKYVIARFELTSKDFQNAWEWMFTHWLPESGYQQDDKPYFETYPEEPKGELFVVDLCIPVKPA